MGGKITHSDWWYTGPSWWAPLAVFIGAVLVFHLILVYSPLKLEKNSWKKVDYIWLTMSVISIVGIISQGRQILASNWVPIAEQQIRYRTNDVNQALGLFIDKGPQATHSARRTEGSNPSSSNGESVVNLTFSGVSPNERRTLLHGLFATAPAACHATASLARRRARGTTPSRRRSACRRSGTTAAGRCRYSRSTPTSRGCRSR
jgi:hypothetical protein